MGNIRMSKKIFDMGKNLKDYKFGDSSIDSPFSIFTGKLLDIDKVNLNGDKISEDAVFHGKFSKKRGRPKMTEQFFYNPNKEECGIIVGIDTSGIGVGSVMVQDSEISGFVTKIINGNTLQINWQLTYKE